MTKALLKKLDPLSIRDGLAINYERIKINFRNFRINPPIIIYQVGKVVQTSLLRSLRNARLPNPIYRAHFLSYEGIQKAEEHYL